MVPSIESKLQTNIIIVPLHLYGYKSEVEITKQNDFDIGLKCPIFNL